MNQGNPTTASYVVEGMTCGHCVSSVTEEVGAVGGVTEVNVDLATGQMRVSGNGPIDDSAIGAAVEEAGYRVASNV